MVGVLLGSPRRVGFYRAIEILERATSGPRVGDYGPVNEESIRFRHDPSLSFATSVVSTITARPRRAGCNPASAWDEIPDPAGRTTMCSPAKAFFEAYRFLLLAIIREARRGGIVSSL